LDEISLFNVPVRRRCFPKEASRLLREALDETLYLALSLHSSSPLAFSAFSLVVLFPRLLLRPLPDGCQGCFAAATLARRCSLLREGKLSVLLIEAHEAHTERVAKSLKASSTSASSSTFSKTSRATILAGARAVGRACKLAFSFGLESDPAVASKFLDKLTLGTKHAHIQAYVPKIKPPRNSIPLKAVTNAFSGMPKKYAARRDGWTWEMLRDAAQTPSTAALPRKFAERFSNGALPANLWAYLASTLMYPFHKKLPEERTSFTYPALIPVTVGSVLTRFGCRVMVRMNRLTVATEVLLSHQFSFDINGGVHQVILACNVALEINPSWLMMDLDSKNAHTFCSRERLEEELELNVAYHYMLESFRALYGKTITVQWRFGNGADRPATSFHMSCEGLRQGDAPSTVYFNVLAARVYMKQLHILNGRGVLFAVADDVKILGPPAVIKELA
jgi:hypothetical protein